MENAGFLKIVILIFALAVPIAIVMAVYKTLFSGLRSISSSKDANSTQDDSANHEHVQDQKQSEKGSE